MTKGGRMRTLWLAGMFWGFGAGILGAQDPPPPPAPPSEDEEELTPEKAMQLLKEARQLMEKSEELLLDSSRGRALEAEKGALERLEKLLREEPGAGGIQGQVLEKIRKLLQGAERHQDGTVQKLKEILRKARSVPGGSSRGQPRQPQSSPPPQQTDRPQTRPGAPASRPYDPNRTGDPINKFRSRGDRSGRWGDLPPRLREAIFSGRRDLDEYPPEFQEALKEYMKRLAEEEEE